MLQLVFWENFHKIGGELWVTVQYEGTGAPITEEDIKLEEARKRKEKEDAEREQKKLQDLALQVQQNTEAQANAFIAQMHLKHEMEKMQTQEEVKKTQEEMKKAYEEMKKLQEQIAAQTEQLKRETEAFEKKQQEILAQKEAAEKEAERLREETKRKEKPPMEVREDTHSHPLKLVQFVYKKGQYICDKCQLRGSGQVYHCDMCKFDMHPSCTIEYAAWQGSRPPSLSPTMQEPRSDAQKP